MTDYPKPGEVGSLNPPKPYEPFQHPDGTTEEDVREATEAHALVDARTRALGGSRLQFQRAREIGRELCNVIWAHYATNPDSIPADVWWNAERFMEADSGNFAEGTYPGNRGIRGDDLPASATRPASPGGPRRDRP